MEQNIQTAEIITQRSNNQKKNRCQNGCGNDKSLNLYKEVIRKNFETIGELLKKLNFLIIRNQQFQSQLGALAKKFTSFEGQLQSIHNEHRRDNLFLHSNMSGIRTEMIGMGTNLKLLFDQIGQGNFFYHLQTKTPSMIHQALQKEDPKQIFLEIKQQLIQRQKSKQKPKPNKQLKTSENKMRNKKFNITSQGQINSSFNYQECSINKIQKLINSSKIQINKQAGIKRSYTSIKQLGKSQKVVLNEKSKIRKTSICKQNRQLLKSQSQISKQTITQVNKQYGTDGDNTKLQPQLGSQNFQLLSSIGKHKQKILQIFVQAINNNEDVEQFARQKLNIFAKKIVNQNCQNVSEQQKNKRFQRVSSELNSLFYGCMANEGASHIMKKIRTSAINHQQDLHRITNINQQMVALTAGQAQMENKIQDVSYKMLQIFETINNMQQQILKIKQQNKYFITSKTIFQETFKLAETSRKLWEQSNQKFAVKEEVKRSLIYIENKINKVIGKSKVIQIQNQQNMQNTQKSKAKCIFCQPSASNSPVTRINLGGRSSVHNNSQTTKRINAHQLKKRTLQFFRKQKQKDMLSKTMDSLKV